MPEPMSVRALADDYVARLADLDTRVATSLGTHAGDDRVPDLSPDGEQARGVLARSVLAALPGAAVRDDDDRRCARLLRERLEAQLAVSDAGEPADGAQHRRAAPGGPPAVRADADRHAGGLGHRGPPHGPGVPEAFGGYHRALAAGAARGLHAAPRQLETVVGQFDAWIDGRWFHTFVAAGPDPLRSVLDSTAEAATTGTAQLRDHLASGLLRAARGTPRRWPWAASASTT